MIDGLFKRHIDPLWDRAARPLAKAFTANQVTCLGLVLSLGLCAAYVLWQSSLWFGLGLAIAFCADSLDGAVARLRNEQSKFGGYLDAMTDRYQELGVLLAIAWVNNAWPETMLVLAGSYLTSYAKARTAIEIPIDNASWPDLFERQERVIYICILLVLQGVFSPSPASGFDLMSAGLWLLAAIVHATAIQRFFRARVLLQREHPHDEPD
jgi:archaetidylinositol phosphate synthase